MFASKNAAIECEEDTDSVLLAAIRLRAAVTGRVSGSKDWVQPNRSMGITTLCAQPSSPLPSTSCCVQQSLSKTSVILFFFWQAQYLPLALLGQVLAQRRPCSRGVRILSRIYKSSLP